MKYDEVSKVMDRMYSFLFSETLHVRVARELHSEMISGFTGVLPSLSNFPVRCVL